MGSLRRLTLLLAVPVYFSSSIACSDNSGQERSATEHVFFVRVAQGIGIQECVNRCLTRNIQLDRANWVFAELNSESCLADRGPFESLDSVWLECAELRREVYMNTSELPECRSWCEARNWEGYKYPGETRILDPCERCENYRLRLEEADADCQARCGLVRLQAIRSCDRLAIFGLETCRRFMPIASSGAWQVCVNQRDDDYSSCMSRRFGERQDYCSRICPRPLLDCSRFCGDAA